MTTPAGTPAETTIPIGGQGGDYSMTSQYLIGESQQNVEFIRNWVMRLSPNERDELLRVNSLANTLKKSEEEYKDPLNMSLRDFVREWANKNMAAAADTMKWLSNIGDYGSYFTDIDSSRQWFTGLFKMARDFMSIFWKDNRAIYIGITLLLLVFFIFVIDAAESSIRSVSPIQPLRMNSLSVGENGVRYMMVPVNEVTR